MQHYRFFLLLLLTSWFAETKAAVNNNHDELEWSTSMGNIRNTRRLIPSIPTEYNGSTWATLFNTSSQDSTVFGTGAGSNGDLYLFITESRYSSADYMLCLTPNGELRWKMHLESPSQMINIGVSNIVSDRVNNLLYYTSSWADTGSFVSKICRVFYPDTRHPAQECVNTYKISTNFLAPLALNTKADLLITTVIPNAPAAFNTTTLEIAWNDSDTMGADPSTSYQTDPLTGDLYWIGGDDDMRKMDANGTRLFLNNTNSGGSRQLALHSGRQIVVRAWKDLSDHDWPLIVSAWNIETTGLRERWQWKNENRTNMNMDCTSPVIDDQNDAVYFVNLPHAIALDITTGHSRWQTEVVTASEMIDSDLAAECTAFNGQTRILYVLVKSMQIPFRLFLIAVHVDTGRVLRRMDLSVADAKLAAAFCPVLIGNEMIYVSWLTGAYPDLVSLTVRGIPQLS